MTGSAPATKSRSQASTARIELTWPLDLSVTLDEGQAFGWSESADDGPATWVGAMRGHVVRVQRSGDRGDWHGSLEVTAQDTGLSADDIGALARGYLRLDDDHARIARELGSDDVLAPIIDVWPGLWLLRQDPWECLVSFILSAQCHLPRIRRNLESLSQACSLHGTAWSQDVHLLPAPEAIIALGESRLRQLGLGFRAPNLLATAHDVADGRIDLEALRSMTYEDARGALLGLRGVGPKIADCVLAFSLNHTEAFAVDRWVSRAVIGRYLGGKRQPEERIAEWGRERFGRHAAYAQQLLFQQEREDAMAIRPLPGSKLTRQRRSRLPASTSG